MRTRYKWPFISSAFVYPVLHVLPLVLIYWGLLSTVSGDFGEVTSENFLPWLLMGTLCYSVFFLGGAFFKGRFVEEKYWGTIVGTLIAPISKYYFLFGAIIQLSIEAFFTTILWTVLAFIILPTSLSGLFLLFLIIFITIIIGASLGLIHGTIILINENYGVFFDYLSYSLAFFSTYSIPYEVFSRIHPIVQGLVDINPLYHIIKIARAIWFGTYGSDLVSSLIYIIIFAFCLMVIGVYLFSKITRHYGVRGY